MVQTIGKWGNSLALRIPKSMADKLSWAEDTKVALNIMDGKLVAEAVRVPLYDLADLVEGITPDNLHAETDSGPAVGSERW